MDGSDESRWSAPAAPLEANAAVEYAPEDERKLVSRASWRGGVKSGFWIVSLVAGPIAYGMTLLLLIPTAVGFGAGRGFGLHPAVLNPAGFYVGSVMSGVLIGGVVGLIFSMLPVRAGKRLALDRPVRLRFWRKYEPEPRALKWRRWPWVLAGIAWLVVVTAYGVGVYLGRVVDIRLANATAAADNDDPNWRIYDLMNDLEPVPDAENSAIVVGEAFSDVTSNWPSWDSAHVWPPSVPTEAQVAYDRAGLAAPNARLDVPTVDRLRSKLGEYDKAVRLLRTVADLTRGRHELVLGPTVLDTPLSETRQALIAGRLMTVDAMLRAHDGHLDEALDSCRAVIGLGRSIGDEPFLISQLVRVVIGSHGLKTTGRVLGQGEPTDAALARLQTLVLDELNLPLLLYGLRGERAARTEFVRRISTGELPLARLSFDQERTVSEGIGGAIAPWGRLRFDNQTSVTLEWTNEAVAIARRPTAEQFAGWKAWDEKNQKVESSRMQLITSSLPLQLSAGLSTSVSDHRRYQAELGATAILLAAERHRRKAGAWPASAEAIAPDILAKAPVDPFSGRPYLFERRDGRLIVHSVGPNKRDEKGEYEPKRWKSGGPDDVGATAWDVALRGQPAP